MNTLNKKVCLSLALGAIMALFAATESMALSPETEQLLELLQNKGVITSQDSNEFRQALKKSEPQSSGDQIEHRHSVQSLTDRVEKLEGTKDKFSNLADKILLSGFVEAELSAEKTEDAEGNDETSSDVTLATAELDIDVNITDHILGHVAFLYEDGEDFTVDQGIIAINGNENIPFYINVGKMYIPFGQYESHFVSDPPTLILGETNDGALLLGYANDKLDISFGIFNGEVNETGEDDRLDNFVASAAYTMPESENFSLSVGISYTSNLAASDSLQDDSSGEGVGDKEIDDIVGGFGAFISASFHERFFVYAEYVGAVDSFMAGDLAFDEGLSLQPATWNLELAYAVNSQVELAGKYGGSDEYGSVVPEEQYGVAALYSPFHNTSIVGEYLHSEFKDDSENDSATIQLAIEF